MSTAAFDRRTFLQRAGLTTGAALAATAVGRRPVAHADEALAPFVHGVASGDPLHDRVVLWTRWTGDAASTELRWAVYRDAELTDEVRAGRRTVDASTDFCCKVDADGLAPATTYYFRFTDADGEVSLTGRTRTLPAPDAAVERFRAAVVSCSNYTGGYFNGYAIAAARDDIDVVLHLGDYIYEYGNDPEGDGTDAGEHGRYGPAELIGVRDHDPDTEPTTLQDYRRRHANYKLDPDLRRLHQLHPFITTWDDHEVTDNSWRDGALNHDPETEGDWAQRKAWAQQAYDEWMPIRTQTIDVIYRAFPIGTLADLLYLDTRYEGRDEQLGELLDPTAAAIFEERVSDPERTLISPAQLNWFSQQLIGSQERGATWRIVGQQVMFMQFDGGQLLDTGGYENTAGQDAPYFGVDTAGNAMNPDAWDGFQAERDRVFDVIDDNGVDNLVILTGDIHTSWAADLPRNAGNPYDPLTNTGYEPANGTGSRGVEFVTPSISSDNINEIAAKRAGTPPAPDGGSAPIESAIKAENVHIKMVDLDRHGLLFLDITPERVRADWVHSTTRLEATLDTYDFRPGIDAWQVLAGANHLDLVPITEPLVGEPRPEPQPAAEVDPSGGGAGGGGDPAAAEDPDLAATGGGAAVLGAAALGVAAALRLRSRDARDGGDAGDGGGAEHDAG